MPWPFWPARLYSTGDYSILASDWLPEYQRTKGAIAIMSSDLVHSHFSNFALSQHNIHKENTCGSCERHNIIIFHDGRCQQPRRWVMVWQGVDWFGPSLREMISIMQISSCAPLWLSSYCTLLLSDHKHGVKMSMSPTHHDTSCYRRCFYAFVASIHRCITCLWMFFCVNNWHARG